MKDLKIDIGISEGSRKEIIKGLNTFLADTYTLYLKTHFFHWNVTGPQFQTLHLMFEGQYNEIWLAVDTVAERIRSLGGTAPGSYKVFSELTTIPETKGVPSAEKMIQELVKGHEAVCRTARALIPHADEGNDEATTDLLTQRLQIHEKTAWMLRSLLSQ